jgi:hypothetical protein
MTIAAHKCKLDSVFAHPHDELHGSDLTLVIPRANTDQQLLEDVPLAKWCTFVMRASIALSQAPPLPVLPLCTEALSITASY